MILTLLPPNQTHKSETGRDVYKENALFVNGKRVKGAITKEKPVFTVLMLESAPKSDPATPHPSVRPLIEEFKDVFL